MAGRGRGRGLTDKAVVLELRKPAVIEQNIPLVSSNTTPVTEKPATPEKEPEIDCLAETLKNLKGLSAPSSYLNGDQPDSSNILSDYVLENLKPTVGLLKVGLNTGDKIKEFISDLYKKCIESPELIRPGVLLLNDVQVHEAEGTRVRNVLLGRLQTSFKEREHIYFESSEKFLATVSFLGESFHSMKMADGSPYLILIKPLMAYMQMCLKECSEPFSEVFLTQMKFSGKILHQVSKDEIEDLMIKVRMHVLSPETAEPVRRSLLVCLELYLTDWKPLAEDVSKVYLTNKS